jgi:hypothetical protein
MWNLQPLNLLLILCRLSTAVQLPLCDQALGVHINARDCVRAFATLHGNSLNPSSFGRIRFFTSQTQDRAYLLPQEASYGSCKVAIKIEEGWQAKGSWLDLDGWTRQLIASCVTRLVGLGGQFLIYGFVIRISRSDASTAADAAAVLTPAALRQAADQLSLSPPAGHDRPGLSPMRPPVPAGPSRQQASLRLLSQAAEYHWHRPPSTQLRYAPAPPADGAALFKASENLPGGFALGSPAVRQDAGTPALHRTPALPAVRSALPAVRSAVLRASGNAPGGVPLDLQALQHQGQAPTLQQLLRFPAVRPFAPAVARHNSQGVGSIAEPLATPAEPLRWGSRKPRSSYDSMWPSSG